MEDETIEELFKQQYDIFSGRLAVLSSYLVDLTTGKIEPGPNGMETARKALDDIALECETMLTKRAKKSAEYQILFLRTMFRMDGTEGIGISDD